MLNPVTHGNEDPGKAYLPACALGKSDSNTMPPGMVGAYSRSTPATVANQKQFLRAQLEGVDRAMSILPNASTRVRATLRGWAVPLRSVSQSGWLSRRQERRCEFGRLAECSWRSRSGSENFKNGTLRGAEMTRKELLSFYAEAIRTPADQVPVGSPVIQAYEETAEGGRKIRICDKVQAGAQLARMCDWNSAERIEVSADSLGSYLLELRAQSLFGGPAVPIERRSLPLGNGENDEKHRGANE